ncbi:MAG TPA: AMP-binding protein [Tepidisphaeraceae bacterium]|nr:AMP-binding protein [Tepidisphaeraceae bacterium]
MIHPFDSMRRWWKTGGPTASIDADGPGRSNGNGAENVPKPAPEPAWLAQMDKAGIPRNLVYPNCTLGRLVDHAAERYGEATAMVYGEQRWTYRELLAQINRMAGGLASLGVRRADRVLFTLPNCPEMVVGFMAAQKLGAVVVNAGPLMGIDDVGTVMSLTTPRVAIGLDLQAPLLSHVNNSTIEHWIWVSLQSYQPVLKRLAYRYKLWHGRNGQGNTAQHLALEKLIEQAPARPPSIEPDPSKTAVLQPTGGTTGTLKLAQLSHRNLLANAAQISAWMSAQAGQDRYLAVLPMFHVYGLMTSFITPVFNAASMILQTRFNARELVEIVRREKPTVMPLVPAICAGICDEFDKQQKKDNRKPAPITGVRLCLSGAAPLPTELAERFTSTTGIPVLEGYGLTEASPVTHVNFLGKPRATSIGLPMPDTRIRVVEIDESHANVPVQWSSIRDVAPGEPGEMLICGPQVMLGYFANPEQTRIALINDEDGNTWLRTGDIVTVDEDGYFHVVDRKKDMIIRSGLKVFPARVEKVLRSHPQVMDAAVVGRSDPKQTEIVVAVVVAKNVPEKGDKSQSSERTVFLEKLSEDLRALCRQHLAPYEVPKLFEFADSLPRSPLGKLLKRELRKQVNGQAVLPLDPRNLDKKFDKSDEDDDVADHGGNGSSRKSAGKKEVA